MKKGGRRPASHAAYAGRSFSRVAPPYTPGCVHFPSEDGLCRCPGSGFATGRYPLRHKALLRSPLRAGKLAGFPILKPAEAGVVDVGFEPTTARLTVLCSIQ